MTTELQFTDNSNEELGFCRFHYPGEESLRDGVWKRSIAIAGDGNATDLRTIVIPEEYCLQLSDKPEQKLVHRAEFVMECAGEDIDPMYRLSIRAGWNQTPDDLRELARLDPGGNFRAGYRSPEGIIPLGTGAILPSGGNTSWIGMVLVHPEVRRQRIAQAIMDRCLAYALLEKNYHINGLDATPMGQSVYLSLGYRETCRLWMCTLDTDFPESESDTPKIRPMESADEAVQYEEKRNPVRRSAILESVFCLSGNGCFVWKDGNSIGGYVMTRQRRLMPSVGPLTTGSSVKRPAFCCSSTAHTASTMAW